MGRAEASYGIHNEAENPVPEATSIHRTQPQVIIPGWAYLVMSPAGKNHIWHKKAPASVPGSGEEITP